MKEFFEALKISKQCLLGIRAIKVTKDSHRAAPAALRDEIEHLFFLVAGADGQNLFPLLIAIFEHAVDVQGEQVGLHFLEKGREAGDLVVAVMEIVDDTDVGGFEGIDQGELIFRITKPAAMIVERDFASDGLGGIDNGTEAGDFSGDVLFLFLGRFGGRAAAHDPELGFEIVAFEDVEDSLGVFVERSGEPPGGDFDIVFAAGVDFGLEGRDVFGAPIVGETMEAEFFEHLSALFGSTLFGVERDDAPGDEIAPVKKRIVRG